MFPQYLESVHRECYWPQFVLTNGLFNSSDIWYFSSLQYGLQGRWLNMLTNFNLSSAWCSMFSSPAELITTPPQASYIYHLCCWFINMYFWDPWNQFIYLPRAFLPWYRFPCTLHHMLLLPSLHSIKTHNYWGLQNSTILIIIIILISFIW